MKLRHALPNLVIAAGVFLAVLCLAQGVQAQTISYGVTGTLSHSFGPDSLGLNGAAFTLKAELSNLTPGPVIVDPNLVKRADYLGSGTLAIGSLIPVVSRIDVIFADSLGNQNDLTGFAVRTLERDYLFSLNFGPSANDIVVPPPLYQSQPVTSANLLIPGATSDQNAVYTLVNPQFAITSASIIYELTGSLSYAFGPETLGLNGASFNLAAVLSNLTPGPTVIDPNIVKRADYVGSGTVEIGPLNPTINKVDLTFVDALSNQNDFTTFAFRTTERDFFFSPSFSSTANDSVVPPPLYSSESIAFGSLLIPGPTSAGNVVYNFVNPQISVRSAFIDQPADASGSHPVTLTFSNIVSSGASSLTTSSSGPVPPIGFSLGNPATYYDISTTVGFSGAVTVCINYGGISYTDELMLKLFHHEGGAWVDRTTSLDTVNNVICGDVASLSPFAVFQSPQSAQAIVEQLIVSINGLVASHNLRPGEGRGITSLLNTALHELDGGRRTAAIRQLSAFVSRMKALVVAGKLSSQLAQPLIDAAQLVLNRFL